MQTRNPDYRARLTELFSGAAFIQHLGVELTDCGPGWCETELTVRDEHRQQDGFVHAGVQATLADHSAGAAAGTLMAADEAVLSVEYKIQLLRPARGDRLTCRAEVLRPGSRIVAVEAAVTSEGRVVSKLTATMALVPRPIQP